MLYLVGQWREGKQWEFQGVFSTKKRALAACVAREYFIAPIRLNQAQPRRRLPRWPGQWYPLAEKEPRRKA